MNQKLNDFISWTGLIGTILSIFSVVAPFIKLKETILITILVMLFLFLVYGFYEMKKLKDKKATISKRFRLLVSFSALSFLILAVLVGINLFSKKEVPCTFKSDQIGIALSSFGKADDNFSFLVHEFLKEEDLEDSIYTIKRIDRNYLDIIEGQSIQKEMDSLCMNSGLLVSGKIDVNDGLFYAKIRFHNFSRRQDSLKIDNDVFPIRNPDISNFSIDNQAQVLADFIAALLSYEQGKNEKAVELFDKCINSNSNPKNDNFLSLCNIYAGNAILNKTPSMALKYYSKAIEIDSISELANDYKMVVNYLTNNLQKRNEPLQKNEISELENKVLNGIAQTDSVLGSVEDVKNASIDNESNNSEDILQNYLFMYDVNLRRYVAIPFGIESEHHGFTIYFVDFGKQNPKGSNGTLQHPDNHKVYYITKSEYMNNRYGILEYEGSERLPRFKNPDNAILDFRQKQIKKPKK